MAKVIVERPRYGSSMPSKKKGYRRSVQRQAIDELPRNESMLGQWHGMQKHLNEHLRPMERFLRSNVGRPWNKVHRDLCEHVSFNNAVQKHVLVHVFQFVHKFVDRQGYQIIDLEVHWRPRVLEPGEMYVCPDTGLLKLVRASRRRQPMHRIQVGPLKQFHLRENSWWEVGLRKLPDDPGELWDIWLERDVALISKAERQQAYGGELIAVSKRPLTVVETRELHRRHSRRPANRRKREPHDC